MSKSENTLESIALHSGENTSITIISNTNVTNHEESVIECNYANVFESTLCTSIQNNFNKKIFTIEHLMSATYAFKSAFGFTIKGNELPIMDGSALDFFNILNHFIHKENNLISLPKLRIKKEITFKDNDRFVKFVPSDLQEFEITCDFSSKNIPSGDFYYILNADTYASEIAPARTFGCVSDLEQLNKLGRAKGANLNNVIAFNDDGSVENPDGMRFENEHIRHKMLDAIGDIALSGYQILGKYVGYCPSHALNNRLLKTIFSDKSNYEISDNPIFNYIVKKY